MSKPIATRASAPKLRKSLESAHSLSRMGVAFVCVPHFTDDQLEVATNLALSNLDLVYFEGEEND